MGINYNLFMTLGGAISGITGLYYTVIKIIREYRKLRKNHAEKILEEAKDYSNSIKTKLEAKINLLEVEIQALETNFSKEIDHVKELQKNELKNLGDKIDSLKHEVNQSHSELIQILTQLVRKN